MAEAIDFDRLEDPLAQVACPKCGSEKVKDSGKRRVFPAGNEVWILKCEDCGFTDPEGHFKRAYRGMPRAKRSPLGH